MSYVRWSCDDGKSDVYVYADINGGWTTMVAGRSILRDIAEDAVPKGYVPELGFGDETHYAKDYTHPEAGAQFNHSTPQEAANNLERLREEGFHVPQFAIDDLREEILDETD